MNKQTFNYHTHTKRCGHADGDDEQYVRAALMAGFQELGFSEHMPYPGVDKPGERMLQCDVEEYFTSLRTLQKRYQDRLIIKIGFEIEYFDDQIEYLKDMRKRCDYMILGQHCARFDGGGYDYLSDDQDVKNYTRQVIAGMKSGLVSMLAHPDYFMLGRRDFSKVCEECAHAICACAAENHIPLEINLNGLRYGKLRYAKQDAYAYPYRAFWEIAAQYPIQVVYGFDAHSPTTLLETRRIDEVEEVLQGLSFSFLKHFEIK